MKTETTHMRETIERVLKILARDTVTNEDYQEARIQLYEALGTGRSDAQGIVEAEDMR